MADNMSSTIDDSLISSDTLVLLVETVSIIKVSEVAECPSISLTSELSVVISEEKLGDTVAEFNNGVLKLYEIVSKLSVLDFDSLKTSVG